MASSRNAAFGAGRGLAPDVAPDTSEAVVEAAPVKAAVRGKNRGLAAAQAAARESGAGSQGVVTPTTSHDADNVELPVVAARAARASGTVPKATPAKSAAPSLADVKRAARRRNRAGSFYGAVDPDKTAKERLETAEAQRNENVGEGTAHTRLSASEQGLRDELLANGSEEYPYGHVAQPKASPNSQVGTGTVSAETRGRDIGEALVAAVSPPQNEAPGEGTKRVKIGRAAVPSSDKNEEETVFTPGSEDVASAAGELTAHRSSRAEAGLLPHQVGSTDHPEGKSAALADAASGHLTTLLGTPGGRGKSSGGYIDSLVKHITKKHSAHPDSEKDLSEIAGIRSTLETHRELLHGNADEKVPGVRDVLSSGDAAKFKSAKTNLSTVFGGVSSAAERLRGLGKKYGHMELDVRSPLKRQAAIAHANAAAQTAPNSTDVNGEPAFVGTVSPEKVRIPGTNRLGVTEAANAVVANQIARKTEANKRRNANYTEGSVEKAVDKALNGDGLKSDSIGSETKEAEASILNAQGAVQALQKKGQKKWKSGDANAPGTKRESNVRVHKNKPAGEDNPELTYGAGTGRGTAISVGGGGNPVGSSISTTARINEAELKERAANGGVGKSSAAALDASDPRVKAAAEKQAQEAKVAESERSKAAVAKDAIHTLGVPSAAPSGEPVSGANNHAYAQGTARSALRKAHREFSARHSAYLQKALRTAKGSGAIKAIKEQHAQHEANVNQGIERHINAIDNASPNKLPSVTEKAHTWLSSQTPTWND